jgi:signal transduction histidine kinase
MRERVRIAHELNDSLLQNTQGMVLRFQAVANRVLPGDPTRELLEGALRRADEVLAAARDRMQDLHTKPGERNYLGESLTILGEQLKAGRAIEFRATIEGSVWGLNEETVDGVYYIGRETLVNAFCRPEVAAIELLLICGTSTLLLRIRDDGRETNHALQDDRSGSEPPGRQEMRERAQKIGAQLQIRSRSGTGTELELRIARERVKWDE